MFFSGPNFFTGDATFTDSLSYATFIHAAFYCVNISVSCLTLLISHTLLYEAVKSAIIQKQFLTPHHSGSPCGLHPTISKNVA